MLARTRPMAYVDPFARMSRDIDRLFDAVSPAGLRSMFNGDGVGASQFLPPMNVWEDDNNFHVETETPGVEMDQIEVLASPETVTIKGKREKVTPENAESHVSERYFGSFERSLTLGSKINVDAVEARLENGVLHLTLPKAEDSARQRRIKVLPGDEKKE